MSVKEGRSSEPDSFSTASRRRESWETSPNSNTGTLAATCATVTPTLFDQTGKRMRGGHLDDLRPRNTRWRRSSSGCSGAVDGWSGGRAAEENRQSVVPASFAEPAASVRCASTAAAAGNMRAHTVRHLKPPSFDRQSQLDSSRCTESIIRTWKRL